MFTRSTILKLPNPTFLVGEEDGMIDEQVMHTPSVPFLYEVKCPNVVCQHCFLMVTLSQGIHCPACGVKDPHHKTYRCLVKPKE